MKKVFCDGCKDDITENLGVVDFYRLRLTCERLHPLGNTADVLVYPPIEEDHHFCGLGCLITWTERRKPLEKLRD